MHLVDVIKQASPPPSMRVFIWEFGWVSGVNVISRQHSDKLGIGMINIDSWPGCEKCQAAMGWERRTV